MNAGPAPAPAVYIHTLGCPKNEADSRGLRRHLSAAGATVTNDPDHCTHIIVNTCGFIRDAKQESIEEILAVCRGYPDAAVLVMGCLVERYRDELREGIPEVVGWFGVAGADVGEQIREAILGSAGAGRHGTSGASAVRLSYAYLKISDGCDESCSFCAIPGIKGPYRSVDAEEILREADACLREGARELVLVGQDTTRWRGKGLALPDLIDHLASDDRVTRVRVMYLQATRIDEGFLRYMASQERLCRYLDVPFQHSHPEVLRRMGRCGDGEEYLRLLDRARCLMPDISLRSTFIVGFPGETEEHFEHLLEFAANARFDYAGGFVYSPEEGTKAAALRPRVARQVATERLNRLNEVVWSVAESEHRRLIGTEIEVLIDDLEGSDGVGSAVAVGRTCGQAPEVDGVTYVEGRLPPGIRSGEVMSVRVRAAVGCDLIGEPCAS